MREQRFLIKIKTMLNNNKLILINTNLLKMNQFKGHV